VIVSKPKKMPLTFSPREWVPLKDALLRIMSNTGARDLALICITRDLRNGRLRSALVEIFDGKERITPLNPSDWQQWNVQASWNPEEGVWVEPYVDGRCFVRRADLDKWYPTPTMTDQSDDTPSTPTTTSKHDARRKPGRKITHDWRLHVAAEVHRLKAGGKVTPTAEALAQFCYNKWKWQPDESDINKLLKYLIND
jgi:hypothetical protein